MNTRIKPQSNLTMVIVLCMVLFSVLSFNCKKDEDPKEPANDMALAGDWDLTRMISEVQGVTETLTESQIDSLGIIWTYKIKNDLTVEQITNMDGSLVSMSGTWSTSTNQLTMILTHPAGGTGTLVYVYVINGNILKLNWEIQSGAKYEAEFTKQ